MEDGGVSEIEETGSVASSKLATADLVPPWVGPDTDCSAACRLAQLLLTWASSSYPHGNNCFPPSELNCIRPTKKEC